MSLGRGQGHFCKKDCFCCHNQYMPLTLYAVADPGFPVGGRRPVGGGGAPTSDAYTFRQKRMGKRKKLILLGGVRWWRPPRAANDMSPRSGYLNARDHFKVKVISESNCKCLDLND